MPLYALRRWLWNFYSSIIIQFEEIKLPLRLKEICQAYYIVYFVPISFAKKKTPKVAKGLRGLRGSRLGGQPQAWNKKQ